MDQQLQFFNRVNRAMPTYRIKTDQSDQSIANTIERSDKRPEQLEKDIQWSGDQQCRALSTLQSDTFRCQFTQHDM